VPPIPEKIGRYPIRDTVGKGGMGVLYRAHDTVLERDVALKMMLVDFSQDHATRERFLREARAVARLQHRNVVTIHELGEVDGTPYIVMELLGGRDLDALLKGDTRLTLAQKLEIAAQLCEGLAYAHDQGIVHRDIKPGNVRVLEDGTVKILDFGIAKFAQSSVTQTGFVMGTPSYMAPEQIMGEPADGRSDLFSVGVLLYELLSGKKPFQGDNPTAVVYQIMNGQPVPLHESLPDVPEHIDQIVMRALQKDPAQRYSKAREMAADLQAVKMMLDPVLHSGQTPIAGVPTGGTTMLNVPLYATKTGPVTHGTALKTPLRPAPVDPGAVAVAEARLEEKGKSTVMWVGAGVVAVVLAVVGYFSFSGGNDPATEGTGAGTEASAGNTGTPAAPGAAGANGGESNEFLVVSSPNGARIVLDGTDTGKVTPAPIAIASVPVGSTLELTLKGYRTSTTKVTEADLKAGNKEIRLAAEARPVRLTVSGAFPFELVQGSQVISASSTRHELTVQPTGNVTARNRDMLLNAPLGIGFDRAQMEVTLPAAGVLTVFSAVETCTISVNGQNLGFPPIAGKDIASGNHTVTLTCPDSKGETQKINVAPGQRVTVTFNPPKVEFP
jgi:predicted Ser/Thr protein kinase